MWKDAAFVLLVGIIVVVLAVFLGGGALGPRPINNTGQSQAGLVSHLVLRGPGAVPPASTPYVIILAPAIGFGILFLFPGQ
jgi:hypothetical protein